MEKHQLPIEKSFLFSSSIDLKVNAFMWCIVLYGSYICVALNEAVGSKVITGEFFSIFILFSLLQSFVLSGVVSVKTFLQGYTRPTKDSEFYDSFNKWQQNNNLGKIITLENKNSISTWAAIFHPYISTGEGVLFGFTIPMMLIATGGVLGLIAVSLGGLYSFVVILIMLIAVPFLILHGYSVRAKNIEKMTLRNKIEGKS